MSWSHTVSIKKPIETQKALFLAFIDFGFVDASFGFHPSPTYEWIFLSPSTHPFRVTHLFIHKASFQLHKQKTGFRNGNEKITSIDVETKTHIHARKSFALEDDCAFVLLIHFSHIASLYVFIRRLCDVSRENSLFSIDVVSCAFATLCSACSKLFLFINEKRKEMKDIRVRGRESENAIFVWIKIKKDKKYGIILLNSFTY